MWLLCSRPTIGADALAWGRMRGRNSVYQSAGWQAKKEKLFCRAQKDTVVTGNSIVLSEMQVLRRRRGYSHDAAYTNAWAWIS